MPPDHAAPALDALLDRLAALREQGAEHFEPVQFHYLDSLAQRLAALPEPPIGTQGKLAAQLAEYEDALHQAKETLQRTGEPTDNPGQFRSLLRRRQPAQASPFAPLQQAYSNPPTDDSPEEGNTLAGLLKQQETRILADNSASAPPPPPRQRELSALRQLRHQRQTHRARQRIDNAITQTPSDAGPLNSHRLVTRSIETLRELSPAYLEHFVSYLDTLMSLEKLARKR
jgi:hypothetical protein